MSLQQINNVLTDKGSKYAVSGAVANSREDVVTLLTKLKSKKKYAKATHNTWALLLSDGTQLKSDDGESGAGMVMLNVLQREHLINHLVIVTRWYGGVHLGADRFRHVKTCVYEYIAKFGNTALENKK